MKSKDKSEESEYACYRVKGADGVVWLVEKPRPGDKVLTKIPRHRPKVAAQTENKQEEK